METSVVIPTYKRTEDLKRCLEALSKQTLLPDEVIVVVRDTDKHTQDFLGNYTSSLIIKIYQVDRPGQVAALNIGLATSQNEIISILDDDTAPHKHWLKRITEIFSVSDDIGGVGGRDWVHEGNKKLNGEKELVGKVQWFGRVIGNHHLGSGPARDVEVLKGANMSYRRAAIKGMQFDERLLGNGAQVHNDMGFSLRVKKSGWRLIYDPTVSIDHFPAQRFDADERNTFNPEAYYYAVYNETLIMTEFMETPFKRFIFISWSIFIGTADKPGVLQLMRLILKSPKLACRKFLINFTTKIKAMKIAKNAALT
ncbi:MULTISPECIES: glycosyltransferase family 2 protein [Paraliobacillus]|uniref:glycosyltransferase family 2 protein n=1 Tax=Paraliobacillus TaxID=200903 RepID=UPI000DD476F8|nr:MULTISPECIES: glycosyltransferase family 2 protein [Paraliobacillus]